MATQARGYTSLRLDRDLLEAVNQAAAERGISRNLLITKALEDFLPRLIPVSELQLTRPNTTEDET